jgi:hypothetical protein
MKRQSIISAVIYLGISAVIAGLFLLGTINQDYTAFERAGGAIWVFILSNIILMPVVIPAVKKRIGD